MPTPHICQHPRSTVLGDLNALNAPCRICNPIPLEKEILAEWDRRFPCDHHTHAKERGFLEISLARQRESFLTMLPPEDRPKLGSENQDIYVAYAKGWNDYRRAYLNNINK